MTVPSYPAPGYPASAPRSRPTTVTVASYLLYLVAVIQVINALAVFAMSGTMRDAVAEAYRGTEAEGAEGVVVGVLVAGGVINLLIGLGLAVLSFFNSRGKNPSRIVTWVVGGISLCCLGLGLGGTALTQGMGTGTTGNAPSQDEVQQRINEAMPSWYTPLTTTLSVVALLAILGVVILLALPASNEFFRKPAAAGFDPSVPYPQGYGQPPYPGQQPPYPGQQPPYPGQEPPYPGQPYPGQSYPGQQGQPGQPAPGLPPYPGQTSPPPPPYPGQTPPPGDERPPA